MVVVRSDCGRPWASSELSIWWWRGVLEGELNLGKAHGDMMLDIQPDHHHLTLRTQESGILRPDLTS